MLKKSMVGIVIVLVGFFTYFQIHSWMSPGPENQNSLKGLKIQNQSAKAHFQTKEDSSISGNIFTNNDKKDTKNQLQRSSGDNLIPEKNPSSKYYLEEEEYKKLKEDGVFKEKAKDKLFEIRRKMIDSNFDTKMMSEKLSQKLNEAPNGKLSYEEFVSLMPRETVADFEEMMSSVREKIK